MKNLLLFFILTPLISFSQVVERDQKNEAVKQRSQRQYNPPSYQGSAEYYSKREEIFNRNRFYKYDPQPFNYYSPYFRPFDFRRYNYYNYPWSSYYWFDDWGYRNYSRIYILPNGNRDTVKMKPLKGSFGLQTTGKEWGIFLTLGKKVYFVAEYQTTAQRDKSVYYPLVTLDQVNGWADKRLEDLVKNRVAYLGIGKRLKKTGFHVSLGFVNERNRLQFQDEMKILSANGRYSIPDYEEDFISYKVGISRNFKGASLKIDYDIVRNQASFGAGINF